MKADICAPRNEMTQAMEGERPEKVGVTQAGGQVRAGESPTCRVRAEAVNGRAWTGTGMAGGAFRRRVETYR